MRRIVLMIAASLVSTASAAQQATIAAGTSRAYGTRVGVRNESPDYPGISLDARAIKRLPTRIETRLNNRVERRADPTDALWAYRIPQTDNSRTATPLPASRVILPSSGAIDGEQDIASGITRDRGGNP